MFALFNVDVEWVCWSTGIFYSSIYVRFIKLCAPGKESDR